MAFSKEQSLNVGEIKGRAAAVATTQSHQNGTSSPSGDTMNDNSEQKIEITVHNYVRNSNDIQQINRGLDNIVTKYKRTKGVVVTQW